MSTDRLKQRIEQFQNATDRLEEACQQPENEFIRDAVIQRFEFCFELAWKMLKLKLFEEGIEAATPRSVIREAVTAKLLPDGNVWSEMLQRRNETSHTYDSELAKKVYQFVRAQGLTQFKSLQSDASTWI